MKHNIFKSLRMEIIVYSIMSLVLALITETIIGGFIVIVARMYGISKDGYGRKPIVDNTHNVYMKDGMFPDYHKIKHWDKNTIIIIVFVMLLIGIILFVTYFLIFTRRITKDMSYISERISDIADGQMDIRIEDIKREDELGDIAIQVNRMSREIKRLMESERDALQANKDMITCVAHDLRTPLTSIIGYLQLATDTEKYSVEERQNHAHIAMRKAKRMQGLIEELFSYTKLMSGEITLHRSNIDIVKLVEQMTEEFYPLFSENGLDYSLKQNVDSLVMNVDAELIARTVSNLISNAIKYGRDGKVVFIELEKYEKEFQIRVTNFGLVIPEESLEHIFDKFYRVEGSRSVQTGGTGLGLNIAQEIVLLHDGRITVTSSDKGTCFTVALPLAKDKTEGSIEQKVRKEMKQ